MAEHTATVEITRDPIAAAAAALGARLLRLLETRGAVRLAIPGGSALAALPAVRAELSERWSRVRLTWVDERCVPEHDAESNRGAARRLGILDAPGPEEVLPLFEDGETPEEAVQRASAGLAAHFDDGLDLLLLGMGEDGHIASLFPSRPAAAASREKVAHVPNSPKPPAHRITLTASALASAGAGVLLAAGAGKRDALERLLAGDPTLPAHGLRGLHIVTDQEISL